MNMINLSTYKFVTLKNLEEMKANLKARCIELELKGTILIASEGINLFISGPRNQIEEFKKLIWSYPELSDMGFKESPSEHQPFARLLVKIKKEIITMGIPRIEPEKFTGPRVSAREFKKWLDEKREVVILDTRNDYEIRLGTFDNAIDLDIKTFRQFPERVKALSEEVKNKTVVSFCTGGIRCEKASAWLIEQGFKDVYQLDGGILKYFEEVGGDHYHGECFVFDYRVGVDPSLHETGSVLCYRCQNPVTPEEQKSPLYVADKSCPHCAGKELFHKEKIAQEIKSASANAAAL